MRGDADLHNYGDGRLQSEQRHHDGGLHLDSGHGRADDYGRANHGSNLGCNPATTPLDADVKAQVTASGGCGALTINVSHVDGGTPCAVTRTFTITATDACSLNSATTTVVYTWTVDTAAPAITGAPAGRNLGCNPATTPLDADVKAQVTASGGCGALTINVSHVDGGTPCAMTRTFTITATDACSLNSATTTVVYTWTVDTAAPAITRRVPAGRSLGCNPATTPLDADVKAQVTASGGCGALTINVSHVDGGTPCAMTRTFTITATDACSLNSASTTVVYTWTVDTAAPAITGAPAGRNLGCNPATTPLDADVKAQVTASGGCGALTINVSHVDSAPGCAMTRTFTITATDACSLNSASTTVVYTWTVDAGPVVNCPPDATVPNTSTVASGAYCTYTQGGWGTLPHGGNPGTILSNGFSTVYPGGVVEIGIPGNSGFSIKFTSATAIIAYLPAGSTPGAR